ncbi:Endonuclease/Exonuclease/phosphatase family protein [Meinhardsimonia xiamenensis]|jgi:hypothetical protein|uniref:Endonuclease/Exonuclease/phosphatase family protein n=1 Tax=Meinhardsimonia xiamenensis TaxID=990712 RepID=A0A1G9FY69_9RHOB|nr:endonuclease/exonuclease/phosphatase family protein [Meinhardsimonia xiamenensis]PRX32755.1 Endonuclease/Exonuclease/phosphatase family protein [Meinhardsimonia xiamenensis]SDK93381.1 Endonuclease/Exonuclease/phosphatase family protein [Meinhardsimonia xiamenensis]
MRIATYNVEWFTNLFDAHGRLLEDTGASGREGITRAEQLTALGIVFTALDADMVLVVEAPDSHEHRSTVACLESFAARYGLRCRNAIRGFESETQQEIALMFDPDVVTARHDPMGDPRGEDIFDAPRFDASFAIDLDVDAEPETVTFSKPPLEAAVTVLASGFAFRLIGVHIKSKAPHGARNPEEARRIAIANRRKQHAQCLWLRRRIEGHLAAGDPLIVLGDFNDGPGLDEYEQLFGRSGVEIVMGEGASGPKLYDPNARLALSQRVGAMPVTARFWIAEERRWMQALLDYIMISPDLCARNPRWRIWHPFDDPVCYDTPELREALLTASDHFPVTLDIDL